MTSRQKYVDRFLTKFDKSDSCWVWNAGKDSGGYGNFWYRGTAVKAHRFSYELFVGKIPESLQIDHLCRVRSCVNPEHLEAVTKDENYRRGMGMLYHKNKTHCPRGHEYDEENTYLYKGKRNCKTCRRNQTIAHSLRRKESAS
jgi:hypothetical protein